MSFTEKKIKLVLDKEVQNFQCLIQKIDLFQCQIDNSLLGFIRRISPCALRTVRMLHAAIVMGARAPFHFHVLVSLEIAWLSLPAQAQGLS
jgi:hypothetical protein